MCVSNEIKETGVPCSSDSECLSLLMSESETEFERLDELPEFLNEKVDEVLDSALYCKDTCKVKRIYGLGLSDIEEVVACRQDEKEIIYEIKGKEGLRMLDYLRQTGRV